MVEPVGDLGLGGVFADAVHQLFKDMKVGEHAGEQLAVGGAVFGGDFDVVHKNFARCGGVQPGEQHGEGGFARAVAADEKQGFAAV